MCLLGRRVCPWSFSLGWLFLCFGLGLWLLHGMCNLVHICLALGWRWAFSLFSSQGCRKPF